MARSAQALRELTYYYSPTALCVYSRAPAGKMLFCLVFVFASPIGIGIGWASANEVGGRFTDVLSSVSEWCL